MILAFTPSSERGKKWYALRGLVEGLKIGATVGIRLPEAGRLAENCRYSLNTIPLVGKWHNGRTRFDVRVRKDRNDPTVLWVTKTVYRPYLG